MATIESEGEKFDSITEVERQVEAANRRASEAANMGKAQGLLGRLAADRGPVRGWSVSRQALGLIAACVCGTVAAVEAIFFSRTDAIAILGLLFTFLGPALSNYNHIKGTQRADQIEAGKGGGQ